MRLWTESYCLRCEGFNCQYRSGASPRFSCSHQPSTKVIGAWIALSPAARARGAAETGTAPIPSSAMAADARMSRCIKWFLLLGARIIDPVAMDNRARSEEHTSELQ